MKHCRNVDNPTLPWLQNIVLSAVTRFSSVSSVLSEMLTLTSYSGVHISKGFYNHTCVHRLYIVCKSVFPHSLITHRVMN